MCWKLVYISCVSFLGLHLVCVCMCVCVCVSQTSFFFYSVFLFVCVCLCVCVTNKVFFYLLCVCVCVCVLVYACVCLNSCWLTSYCLHYCPHKIGICINDGRMPVGLNMNYDYDMKCIDLRYSIAK